MFLPTRFVLDFIDRIGKPDWETGPGGPGESPDPSYNIINELIQWISRVGERFAEWFSNLGELCPNTA
jgi:hypothetical protein